MLWKLRISRHTLALYLSFLVASGLAFANTQCHDKEEKHKPLNMEVKENTIQNNKASNQKDWPAILFLGDSLTAGYGLAENQSPPALIGKKIQAANLSYSVINAGRSGDTTAGGLARLDWYLKEEQKIQHFIIGLGSNDSMLGFEISTIEGNLQKIISKVKQFDKKIKIYLWEMYTFSNLGPKYAQKYHKLFGKLARKNKIILLPFPPKGVATNVKMNQSDGVHPNAQGAEILAKNIWKVLRTHL